jgi:hypothetical protein
MFSAVKRPSTGSAANRDPELEAAACLGGITAMERFNGHPFELVCQACGESEVESTDRVGVGRGHLGKRTGTEDELEAIATLPHPRLEAPATDRLAELVGDRTSRPTSRYRDAGSCPTTDVLRTRTGTEHLDEKLAQAFIGAARPPPPIGGRVGLEHERRATGPIGVMCALDDEASGDELGNMLPHGVMVESKSGSKFGDTDRTAGLDDETEDLVPGRVTEGLGLLLERHLVHGREKITLQVSSLG